ncbi:type II secretion system F family protein [Candidatus Uhrbacteria bacterium]|nr:type II secretion system F family protein [Candidatus Uhrbacteria bacterium]
MTLQAYLDKLTPITVTDKLFFVQYLSMMLKAGMSLAPALASIIAQTKNRHFQSILSDIRDAIEHGTSFARALESHERHFGALFVNMVRIGELSGTLEHVLSELYTQMKKEHEMRGKVRGALVYPTIVIIAMITIGAGVMIFIVPKMTAMFNEFKATLPLPTRILMKTSAFMIDHGFLMALATILVIGGFIFAIRRPRGKQIWHTILLHMPIIGPIVIKINIARLTRTLGTLLSTAVPIADALTITGTVVTNIHYKQLLATCADSVKRGSALGTIFPEMPKLIPPTLAQMVMVGEQTGSLDTMLKEIAIFYENEVEQIMSTLPSLIEPLLMLILGVGVGSLAVAIIMPMYSLAQQI